jgi:hypothetical protein
MGAVVSNPKQIISSFAVRTPDAWIVHSTMFDDGEIMITFDTPECMVFHHLKGESTRKFVEGLDGLLADYDANVRKILQEREKLDSRSPEEKKYDAKENAGDQAYHLAREEK